MSSAPSNASCFAVCSNAQSHQRRNKLSAHQTSSSIIKTTYYFQRGPGSGGERVSFMWFLIIIWSARFGYDCSQWVFKWLFPKNYQFLPATPTVCNNNSSACMRQREFYIDFREVQILRLVFVIIQFAKQYPRSLTERSFYFVFAFFFAKILLLLKLLYCVCVIFQKWKPAKKSAQCRSASGLLSCK